MKNRRGKLRMPKLPRHFAWLDRHLVALHKSGLFDVGLIHAVHGFKIPITRCERVLAQCEMLSPKKYVINLRMSTHHIEEKLVKLKTSAKTVLKNVDHKSIPKREILSDLAHEIAHIMLSHDFYGHPVEHEYCATACYMIFLRQLRKDVKSGLVLEEDA